MLSRSLLFLAVIAGISAVVLFFLHSFLYLAVALVALLFLAFAAAAKAMLVPSADGTRPIVTAADVVRLIVLAIAVFTLSVTVVSSEGPAGQQSVPSGLVIDAIAGGAIIAVTGWWWVERSNHGSPGERFGR